MSGGRHQPVLLAEVVDALCVRADGVYVDATFGRGGHARAVLARLGPRGRLLAFDRDPEACAAARVLADQDARVEVVRGPFSTLAEVLDERGLRGRVAGVVADLGVSSDQLEAPERGFSFRTDGPLDMRMDPTAGRSAAEWLARVSERELADVLYRFGEERHARRVARRIVERRRQRPITRTAELADVVRSAVPRGRGRIDPATRSFQAIRIAVNDELGELAALLGAAVDALAPGGRLAVVSFHSLEDRMVKRFLRAEARPPGGERPRLRLIGRQTGAGSEERRANPRARSARLRVAERLP